jgi:two-component system sensor histidine kinase/response regulator
LAGTGISRQKKAPESATGLFDPAEALARVDGDIELMASLIDIFFTESVAMMEAIRDAVANHDTSKLEKAAHRLKGSVSIFGAQKVSATAFELEKMGRAEDLTQADGMLGQLEQQIAGLRPALKQFHCELQASS